MMTSLASLFSRNKNQALCRGWRCARRRSVGVKGSQENKGQRVRAAVGVRVLKHRNMTPTAACVLGHMSEEQLTTNYGTWPENLSHDE